MKITQPTLLLDPERCRNNIQKMASKALKSRVVFRPHFKTHQSVTVGNWFRDAGVNAITVSSVRMAEHFADNGWNDITIAFPVNILEMEDINRIAARTSLNLLVESDALVAELGRRLTYPAGIFIEIDTGYPRSGALWNDYKAIQGIISKIQQRPMLRFRGFLTHSGHTYQARSRTEVTDIYQDTVQKLNRLKMEMQPYCTENILLSVGDTPSCSIADDFDGVDEIRPGNFVFYDVMQYYLGSCTTDDIAVAMACPVVAVYPARNEIVIYGGAVHFSKDSIVTGTGVRMFGLAAELLPDGWRVLGEDCYLSSLSQEHGIVKLSNGVMKNLHHGSVIGILPVHACLTVSCLGLLTSISGAALF